MKVNIIIPFYKNYDTIENLIRSLSDQDYKDFDATIVIDGEDKKARAILEQYYKDGDCVLDFKLYRETLKENKGANAARNFGAEISSQNLVTNNKNNILFFLDADCVLYPGVLREVVTQLDDNKDIDFVYGNYRVENKENYISLPFDEYRLQTMNYVSTMSPVRRKAFNKVKGFNDAPYFQDWSLFYRLAKSGSKGKYLNEFLFSTQRSGEDNISGTKGLTLDEKAKEFRKREGIKDKRIVATSYGADYQALQRAKMLDCDFVSHQQGAYKTMPVNYGFSNWEATYMTGCYSETVEALGSHLNATVGRPIFHFIGTDVFHMLNLHPVSALNDFRKAFEKKDSVIFVNSPRCLEEMKMCGFKDAKLLYTPIYNQESFSWKREMPNDFTVAVYYSDSNPLMRLDGADGMSNLPMVREIANAMPTIKFKFFGGNFKYLPKDIEASVPENVEFCGRISEEDMPNFINSCSMILRSTIHDGFPQLPIQFLLSGRQALVSCPDESMKYAKKISAEEIYDKSDDIKEEIIKAIYKMSDNQDALKGKVDEIHAYYSELMSIDKFRNEVYSCLSVKDRKDCDCTFKNGDIDKSGMCKCDQKEWLKNGI
jgi:glycosyltransferase involved in cell wall biosynthesis